MRGGEKVVEALCDMFPDADVYTLFYDPDRVSPSIRAHTVGTSFLQPLRKYYRSLLPLMPAALENLDLRGYDLVISSESGPAKGVLISPGTRHICYCHTPMRYVWDLYHTYRNEWIRNPIQRVCFTLTASYLRTWDYAAAQRVDQFVANSDNVRQRISNFYRRDAKVIHPPVDVVEFYWRPSEDYFLIVSELVAHKRVETAIRACRDTGQKLRIVGDGPEFRALRRLASSNIEFCGRVPARDLREIYARCRALLLPGDEDFGIVAVEALASGKPVIALGRGGALETVPLKEPTGGLLYSEPTRCSLALALKAFDRIEPEVNPDLLQMHAKQFGKPVFIRKINELIDGQTKRSLQNLCRSMTSEIIDKNILGVSENGHAPVVTS